MISIHDTVPDPTKPWQYARGFRLGFTKSMDDLEAAVLSHVWSPNIFKNGHRANDNFMVSYYMTLDFDDGMITLKEAATAFHDYQGIIATTKSHRMVTDSNPLGGDRFRVVIPWEKPITDHLVYAYNMELVIADFEADSSCVDRGRFYFPCKEIVASNDGEDYYKWEVKPLPPGMERRHIEINYNAVKTLQDEFKRNRSLKPWQERFLRGGKLPDPTASRRWCLYYIARDLYLCGVDEEKIFHLLLAGKYDKTGLQNLERDIRDRMKSAKKKAASILASIPDAKILPFRSHPDPS